MPRPHWHTELNGLKLYPMFSWTMNLRLMRFKAPKRITQLHITLARRIDQALHTDRNGHTAPSLIAELMTLLGKTTEATRCKDLALRILQHNRLPYESHITPIHRYAPEICYLPPQLQAELETGHDPETPNPHPPTSTRHSG